MVYKIRQEQYPNDIYYKNNIINTIIKLNNIDYNLIPSKIEYYDQNFNKKEEIITIACNFQINMMTEVKMQIKI